MPTNIEQAIATVRQAEQPLTLHNVRAAYFRVAGLKEFDLHSATAFEHAMDKYPDVREKANSSVAQVIKDLRNEYWTPLLEAAAKLMGIPQGRFDCACRCGNATSSDHMKMVMGLLDGEDLHVEGDSQEVTPSTKKRKRRSLGSKSKTKTKKRPIPFDPYAASSSRSSM